MLSLKLDESEELGTKKILQSLPAQYLGHTRQMVQNAYRLKKEGRVALEVALKSNNDLNLWERAYRTAQTADEAAQTLLVGQLHCDIIGGGHGLGVLLSIILVIADAITKNIAKELKSRIISDFVNFTSILLLPQIRHSHPYNECLLLSHDHLKRDFKLKLKTDLFVENLFQNKELKPTNDTLVKLSIFQPQCFTEHDDITDQMMAESAFGRGSNTNRNNHSH